ncbi:MAG: hypothetical protein EP330_16780 [Deltaproteobacteria bacterium]|nr:MAG: hypothetical protein EP330_16780 [Deltaproteobacteria bacterium]
MPALLWLFFACSTWEPVPQTALDAAYTDCSDGATCVVVELGCCDSCNGGAAVAVRSDQEQAVFDEHGESCGGAVACTEMGCAPLTAECNAGSCVLVEGSF